MAREGHSLINNIKKGGTNMNKNQKGFTLVELIVVIAVLALLAVGAVLAFQGIQANARRANVVRAANNLATAINAANTTAGGRGATFLDGGGQGAASVLTAPAVGAVPNPVPTTPNTVQLFRTDNGDAREVFVVVPPGQGLGAEIISVTFSSQIEMERAFQVVGVPPGTAGAPPGAVVNNPAISAWDSTSPSIAWQ